MQRLPASSLKKALNSGKYMIPLHGITDAVVRDSLIRCKVTHVAAYD